MTSYVGALRSWWHQPDHYDWLSSYLEVQGLRGLTRFMMVVVILLLCVAPLIMHWSPGGPAPGLPTALSWGVSAVTAGLTLIWARRWPTAAESKFFAIISALCVAAACMLDQNPAASLLGCAVFAALAGYVAFFHTSPYLVGIIGLAIASAAFGALRVAAEGDPAAAISKFLVITVGVLAVPCSVQVVVHLLGSDAAESDIDALTGVRNRRGFYRAASDLVLGARDAGTTISLVLVDLDGFKRINDTRGHTAGDKLLIAVSDILRRHADGDSVAARFGGEEFVIAGNVADGEAVALADRVRQDVAALPDSITVSVGAATAHVGDIPDVDVRALLDRLVEAADTAMYDAKRAGGNRVQLSTRPVRAH
jgi:diguanylate cyclase (GGDEF)-like protein